MHPAGNLKSERQNIFGVPPTSPVQFALSTSFWCYKACSIRRHAVGHKLNAVQKSPTSSAMSAKWGIVNSKYFPAFHFLHS